MVYNYENCHAVVLCLVLLRLRSMIGSELDTLVPTLQGDYSSLSWNLSR